MNTNSSISVAYVFSGIKMSDKTFGEKVKDLGENIKEKITGTQSPESKAHHAVEKAERAEEHARHKINEANIEKKCAINEAACDAKQRVDEHDRYLKDKL